MKRVNGAYGAATQIPIPANPLTAPQLDYWLISGLNAQYIMACVVLKDDMVGFPEPKRKYPGTTHEILLAELEPAYGPYSIKRITKAVNNQSRLPYITPVNIAEQFIATDEEMMELLNYAAKGVVNGNLKLEIGNVPERIREDWLKWLSTKLAHIRGEEHTP